MQGTAEAVVALTGVPNMENSASDSHTSTNTNRKREREREGPRERERCTQKYRTVLIPVELFPSNPNEENRRVERVRPNDAMPVITKGRASRGGRGEVCVGLLIFTHWQTAFGKPHVVGSHSEN